MPAEIERKFLLEEGTLDYVTGALFPLYHTLPELRRDVLQHGVLIQQGYFAEPISIARTFASILKYPPDFMPAEARLREKDGLFYITVKGDGDLVRAEFESEIPNAVFEAYWHHTRGRRVTKMRLAKDYDGHAIEFDVYTDRNLVVAEVEFPSREAAARFEALGKDVTDNPAYKNRNLAR